VVEYNNGGFPKPMNNNGGCDIVESLKPEEPVKIVLSVDNYCL